MIVCPESAGKVSDKALTAIIVGVVGFLAFAAIMIRHDSQGVGGHGAACSLPVGPGRRQWHYSGFAELPGRAKSAKMPPIVACSIATSSGA